MFDRILSPIILAALGLVGCQESGSPQADLVFVGGTIYTADSNQTVVSAMAVSGDRILAIGSDTSL
ncbi:MAG: hypothetical protein ACPHLL_03720, partial [Porticoccaceae bacterium]